MRSTTISASASRSLGRPAARFVRISPGRSRHRHRHPNISTSTLCGTSAVIPAAGDFAQQVDVADGGRQREVEAPLQRDLVPFEGQPGRRSPQVRGMGLQGGDEAPQVRAISRVDEVHVLREARRPVDRCGETADDHAFGPCLAEDPDDLLEVGHRSRFRVRPARRASAASRCKAIRFVTRSVTERRRFCRSRVRSTWRLYASITGSLSNSAARDDGGPLGAGSGGPAAGLRPGPASRHGTGPSHAGSPWPFRRFRLIFRSPPILP